MIPCLTQNKCLIISIGVPAKPLQSCPTLCDSMDCNLPGSFVHGILQTRIVEWIVMPYSRGSSSLVAQMVKNLPAMQETQV